MNLDKERLTIDIRKIILGIKEALHPTDIAHYLYLSELDELLSDFNNSRIDKKLMKVLIIYQ